MLQPRSAYLAMYLPDQRTTRIKNHIIFNGLKQFPSFRRAHLFFCSTITFVLWICFVRDECGHRFTRHCEKRMSFSARRLLWYFFKQTPALLPCMHVPQGCEYLWFTACLSHRLNEPLCPMMWSCLDQCDAREGLKEQTKLWAYCQGWHGFVRHNVPAGNKPGAKRQSSMRYPFCTLT